MRGIVESSVLSGEGQFLLGRGFRPLRGLADALGEVGYENKDRVIRRNSRSSALVNKRVTRGVSGGVFPHEPVGRWTMTCQGPTAADWRLACQSRSQCARLPTCPLER